MLLSHRPFKYVLDQVTLGKESGSSSIRLDLEDDAGQNCVHASFLGVICGSVMPSEVKPARPRKRLSKCARQHQAVSDRAARNKSTVPVEGLLRPDNYTDLDEEASPFATHPNAPHLCPKSPISLN